MLNPKLAALAPDLRLAAPRSLRASLGVYPAIAARVLDKCRAELAGQAGSYHYNCPLDQAFFRFTGIDSETLKQFVATGANDDQVAQWLEQKSMVKDPRRIGAWANRFRWNPLLWLLDLDDWVHQKKHASHR
jgi:Domain of unknown function (DUF5069)